jgi:translation initiation factor 2 beta subunit (eIF-2beta)/eIF-5
MTSAEERRTNTEIVRNLKSIADELTETNRLLSEFLKLELRHEGKRKESAEK